MESYSEAWNMVRQYCKDNISETVYSLWLEPLELVGFEDNKVILQISDFKANIIKSKFMDLLNEAFENTLGFKMNIEFVSPDKTIKEEKEKIEEDEKQKLQNKKFEFTFDTFIVGASNKFAYAAAQAVSATPGQAYNPLFIYGNSGLGKTHLLNAICTEIKKNTPDAKIIYISGEDFTNELVLSLERKAMPQFHDKYRNADVLLMDDVQFIGGRTQTQEEFFHTFNTLIANNKQIVLTSDRPPKEINTLADRIRNRFESGLLADIQPPDIETRMAIIKRKAELLDFELPNDVVQYIAENLKTNIRQLEGAVKKINAYYIINGHEPSILIAQKAIKDILNNDQPVTVTIDKILNEVARTYGVSVENILSSKRNADISSARQAAMYIIREVTSLPVEKIGEQFGGKHHSTVLYNINQAKEDMENNPQVKSNIQNIINNLNNN